MSSSSVVASVTGVITVAASSTTTSTSCSADPCTISGALVSGAQSLTTTVSTDSVLVRYDFTNTCSQVLQASVSGLPPGVTYIVQEVSPSLAYVQLRGIPTSVGNYNYTINVDNSLIATASAPACAATASTTITGSISVVASSTAATSCTQASVSLVSGNPDQNITLGNAIGNVTWGLSTDCPPDSNGVPLNSSASGLPPGVIYSFSGQNQQIILSGTPSSVGTYSYNIVYYNGQQLLGSSVTTSVGGRIVISSAVATNCSVSGSITSGNANQTIVEGQSITDIIGSFSSSCSYTLTSNASGLPSGLTSTFNNNQLLIGGTPNSGPGTYTYQVAVYDIPPSGQVSSLVTVGGTISIVASSTAATSCSQASISLVSGNPNQNITLGNAIGNVTWGLSTDCPPDGNGVPLNSSASGLPPGVIYSFSGQSQQIFLSGTPSSVGTYSYNIVYYNAQQLSNSSVVASITGTIGISSVASSTTSTQSWSIDVTAQNSANYQLSGNDRNGTVTGNDPTVTIALGDTLNFNVDAPGHPFYLKTQSGTGTANQVSGATNQGTENGTVTWTPTATGTYYYICSLHGGMVGTIIVQ